MIDYRTANITLSLVTKNSIELSGEITCFDLDMKANQICILRFSFNSFWTKKIERLQENACVGNGWVDAWIVVVT